MNRMQEWLARAAHELRIRVVVGYVAVLPDGSQIQAQALFPDFGGTFGTLVFDSADTLDARTRADLAAQGYSISTFSEPLPKERFDIDSYAQMLSDWGWTSNELRKPPWMS
jgi:hypothetical protein